MLPARNVVVTHAGKPLRAVDIKKIETGVYKYRNDVPASAVGGTHFSNYSFMFDFKVNADGSITITPVPDLLEIGSYTLYVHTRFGKATGRIDANLSDKHPSPPRKKTRLPDFSYEIVLPDYAYGQEITVYLKPDEVNTYFWSINGEAHSSGLGKTSFRAQLDPGTYEISFIARNPDGDIISSWSDTTEVRKK